MSLIQQNFTTNQSVTITLASLANSATATSSVINNSTNKFMSADVQFKIRTGTGTTPSGQIKVFLVRTADGGTTYDTYDNNTLLLGTFVAATDTTTFIFSLETSIIGPLPTQWKLLVLNLTGAALDSTGGNFNVVFTGKKYETA
jgi:hypothetical protein